MWGPPRSEGAIERIRRSVIGDDAMLDGPFGPHRLVDADYTASGRALSFIEEYIHSAYVVSTTDSFDLSRVGDRANRRGGTSAPTSD